MEDLFKLDEEIDYMMATIRACFSLPPAKRALATMRVHEYLRLLEEARKTVAVRLGLW